MAGQKLTSQMTLVELARVYASMKGYRGSHGGWISGPDGNALCQGWDKFAKLLETRGVIKVGAGIDWTLDNWQEGKVK